MTEKNQRNYVKGSSKWSESTSYWWKDKFLRLFAKFENYRKRTSKERLELFKTASQELMVALLPISDDMDRALLSLKNQIITI